MDSEGFQCFCGDGFQDRDELIRHNVDAHQMSEDESRRGVDEKYPRMA